MLRRIRRRLTFANVCSFLALTIALGTGGAYAANTIGSDDIIDNSIQSVDVKDRGLHNIDIAANQLTGSLVLDGSLSGPDLAGGSVDSSKVVDESLTSNDLGTDSVQATEIADGSIDSGEIVDNSLGAVDLAPNAAGASEIAASAVGSAKVANDSLTLADLAGIASDGTISLSGIANGRCTQFTLSIGGAQVGDSAIITTRDTIQDGIVLSADRVPSAGHLIMNACNFSGGAMDPISNLGIRIVTFR